MKGQPRARLLRARVFLGGMGLALATLLPTTPSSAAASATFALGVGVHYANGDYGTDTETDSLRIPLTLDYFPTERIDFELVVPYLYQSNSNTLAAAGMRFPFERRMGMRRTAFDTTDSVSGLGDISLTAGYLLLQGDEALPSVRTLLYLKLPTADEEKGLGTGEFDFGAGVGAAQWFGLWYTFAEGRYVFQGSDDDLGLKDYATLEGEAGYRMTDRFLPTLSLWYSTPPAEEASDLLEARINATWWMTDDLSLKGYVAKGLSNRSADLGAGLAFLYYF